jgi:hypothetical protein
LVGYSQQVHWKDTLVQLCTRTEDSYAEIILYEETRLFNLALVCTRKVQRHLQEGVDSSRDYDATASRSSQSLSINPVHFVVRWLLKIARVQLWSRNISSKLICIVTVSVSTSNLLIPLTTLSLSQNPKTNAPLIYITSFPAAGKFNYSLGDLQDLGRTQYNVMRQPQTDRLKNY